MEKIFKKSLALVLSAALCLTALVGCLTVSAEGASATVTVGSVEVNSDATTAKVPVTITATGDGIAAAMFELKVDTTKINLSGLWEDIATNIKTESDSIGINVSVSNDGDNVTTVASEDVYRFIVEGVDPTSGENVSIKQFTNASFDLTFNIASGATGENAIEFVKDAHAQACNAGKFNIETGKFDGSDEALVPLTGTNGKVTVKAASTEPVVDENISCTFGAGLSTTPYLSFVFTNSELTAYDSFELKVTRNTNDNDFNFTSISDTVEGKNPVTGTDNIIKTTKNTYYYYYGIELYSLNVPVDAVLYCKNAAGEVVAKSKVMTSTLKEALIGNYNKTKSDKVKTAIADTIVAAAEVQKFVTLSAQNSDYAKLPLPTEGFDTSLATAELGVLADYNTPNNGDVVIAPGAAVAASPYLSFNMANVNADELADYNIVISYNDPIYKKEISTTINLADPSVLKGGSKYYAYFHDMSIYATNVEVTAKLYKGNSSDPISTYGYSFDTFINAKKSNAMMGECLISLGKLGQSFRAMNGL